MIEKLDKEKILEILEQNKINLSKFSVKNIALFGSYVLGSYNENSDIDFLVEFENPTLDNFMNLIEYLENLFNKKVDVLTPMGLKSIRIKSVSEKIKNTLVYV